MAGVSCINQLFLFSLLFYRVYLQLIAPKEVLFQALAVRHAQRSIIQTL